jgi:hypothetical protein
MHWSLVLHSRAARRAVPVAREDHPLTSDERRACSVARRTTA